MAPTPLRHPHLEARPVPVAALEDVPPDRCARGARRCKVPEHYPFDEGWAPFQVGTHRTTTIIAAQPSSLIHPSAGKGCSPKFAPGFRGWHYARGGKVGSLAKRVG